MWPLTNTHGLIFDGLPEDPSRVLVVTAGEIGRARLDNGHVERISGNLLSAGYWVVDSHGNPRAAMLPDSHYGELTISWRPVVDGEWRRQTFTAKEGRFVPRGVAQDGRSLFGWEVSEEKEVSIARFDMATGRRTPAARLPGLDPTTLLYLGRLRQPFAAVYAQGAAVSLVALEPSDAPAVARLQQHFTGFYPQIVDALPGGKTWLVWVGNSRLPGAYFLFNHETDTGSLIALSHSNALGEERLAAAEYFTFARRGGGQLNARLWRPKNIPHPPLIVYCPEQLPADQVIDLYQPEVQAFVAQGFAVLRVNIRNSWAFGAAGRQIPADSWMSSLQEDLDDAVQELVTQKIVDPNRVTLFGNGFGGILALQVATLSKRFAAVATVNVPARMYRDDLLSFSNDSGSNPLIDRMGGWSASGKFARDLSPVSVAPLLPIPALYLHNEESIKGRPVEDGRDIRSAIKSAKAPAQSGLAYSWSQYPKTPSKLAAEAAGISMKVAAFFKQAPPLK